MLDRPGEVRRPVAYLARLEGSARAFPGLKEAVSGGGGWVRRTRSEAPSGRSKRAAWDDLLYAAGCWNDDLRTVAMDAVR